MYFERYKMEWENSLCTKDADFVTCYVVWIDVLVSSEGFYVEDFEIEKLDGSFVWKDDFSGDELRELRKEINDHLDRVVA
jgi:hypothetical protein